ncbi:hypothetical protein JVT61DRAFT_9550 [Boletus reticuloceps]|uniref:Uncharacterized protein n=1 Tax=Boletus reticuloceps TaxID=495285 RepID=A0A8I2YGL3_9AGAM|nr:hypothetical protein JVT61DRAFT_9550 [Boletus reticuloceps]
MLYHDTDNDGHIAPPPDEHRDIPVYASEWYQQLCLQRWYPYPYPSQGPYIRRASTSHRVAPEASQSSFAFDPTYDPAYLPDQAGNAIQTMAPETAAFQFEGFTMAAFQFDAAQNLTTPQFDTILDPTTFLCDTADDLSSPPQFPPTCSLAVAPHFNVPHGLTAPHLDTVHNLTLTPNFDLAAAPQIPSGVSHQIECHPLIRVPGDLIMRLREEKARCVADLVFDVGMFLWVHMQGEGIGRVPTDILCKEKLVRAIERRQR